LLSQHLAHVFGSTFNPVYKHLDRLISGLILETVLLIKYVLDVLATKIKLLIHYAKGTLITAENNNK